MFLKTEQQSILVSEAGQSILISSSSFLLHEASKTNKGIHSHYSTNHRHRNKKTRRHDHGRKHTLFFESRADSGALSILEEIVIQWSELLEDNWASPVWKRIGRGGAKTISNLRSPNDGERREK